MSYPPVTPMRPVPGAFLNTPAALSRYQTGGQDPTRRQLFPTSASSDQLGGGGGSGAGGLTTSATTSSLLGGGAGPQPSSLATGGLTASASTSALVPTPTTPIAPPRAETVAPVIKAARAVNQCLQADENFPDLDSYIRRECGRDRKRMRTNE